MGARKAECDCDRTNGDRQRASSVPRSPKPHVVRTARSLRPRSEARRRARRRARPGSLRADTRTYSKVDVFVLDDFLFGPNEGHRNAAICSRCSKIVMTDVPQSSPLNYPRKLGTRRSATPRSLTRSAIASSTTHTSSRCADLPCGRRKEWARLNPNRQPDHVPVASLRSRRARMRRNGCSSRTGTRARVDRNTQLRMLIKGEPWEVVVAKKGGPGDHPKDPLGSPPRAPRVIERGARSAPGAALSWRSGEMTIASAIPSATPPCVGSRFRPPFSMQ